MFNFAVQVFHILNSYLKDVFVLHTPDPLMVAVVSTHMALLLQILGRVVL